jgi:hypothetical protein
MQKLLFQVAEHRRQTAHSDRVGTVTEVQGNKMKVQIGIKKDGTPWLSPWIHTTDHRGGERQKEVYAVGQNVRVSATGADFRQATISPYAPNKQHAQPDHAGSAGDGAHTWQNGNSTLTKNDGSHNLMQGDGSDPDVNARTSTDGGFTGFVKAGGAHNRVQTHKDGVCISWKDDENTIHVDKDGCWCSKPLQIKKPEWKADNKSK